MRLQRAVLARDQDVLVGAGGHLHVPVGREYRRLVESLAGRVVLLAVLIARLRVARHDDSGLGALDPRQPRVACLDEVAVLLLQGVLTHVPHVPLLVLRVVVEGPLDRGPVLGHGIPHHRGRDAQDLLGLTGHDLVVDLGGRPTHALVVVRRARLEGPVSVVDRRDEVRRVDRGLVGPVNRGQGRRRCRSTGRRGGGCR